jgi:cell division protein FtsA
VRLLVCEQDEGCLRYRGHAAVPSRGWHRGQISDQAALAECIRRTLGDLETKTGLQVGSAVVGVGGPTVRSLQARGLYEFGHRRPIEPNDLTWAVNLAARARPEEGRTLLQVLPQDFTVDGHSPSPHPVNVECFRLEAHVLLITVSSQEHQTLVSAVHQAHLKVEETVFEAMAAAYAAVMPEERQGGVGVLDIGSSSTNAVFYDGDAMMYAVGLPISGDHFTRDIGELKALSFDEAERLKMEHGCALLGLTADNISIGLPPEFGRPVREVSRRELIEILEARGTQLYEIIEGRRRKLTREVALREGLVLCGGAAQLEGMVELAEKVIGCPARLGFARGIDSLPDELNDLRWTVAAGLAMYSARLQLKRENKSFGLSLTSLFTGKL